MRLISKVSIAAAVALTTAKFAGLAKRQKYTYRDKLILITGGSRGLGLALAEEFGSHGARILLAARENEELREAVEKLAAKGIQAKFFACDITQSEQMDALVRHALESGGVDVLINNAGVIKVAPMSDMQLSDYEEAMNLMFWAPLKLTLALLPELSKRSGQVINISSVGGRVSVPHLLPYSCAKFALAGFSRGLSSEAHRHRVHVLSVFPGLMRTGSYLHAEFKGKASEEFEWFGLAGNSPAFSVSVEYAARAIRMAAAEGRSTCTISLPAKLLVAGEALAPDVLQVVLSAADQFILPSAGGTKNSQSGKSLSPQFGSLFQAFTTLGRAAAARYNE
jgi:short-subunit dehydrogenase